MMFPKKGINQQAKELSKKSNEPVSVVKENGSKRIVSSASIKNTPTEGQPKKSVRTYEGGNILSVEKQGTDILGRPKVKVKTYGDDMYKEKKTLVGGKIKNRDYPLAESNF